MRAAGLALAALITMMSHAIAATADPAWMNAPYHVVIVSQNVQAVLKAFGRNVGVPVSVAPDVAGIVHGSISDGRAKTFLDNVTRENGLDWYYDGSVIYVTPVGDERSASAPLGGRVLASVQRILGNRGLLDARYGFRSDDAGGVLLSGPPAYVSIVTGAIENLGADAAAPGHPSVLTIYRGDTKSSASF